MASDKPDRTQPALAAFTEGHVCSQAVLLAFAPELGLEREVALRIAAPFGGGIGRMGLTCGAVSGALMVIGLKLGPTDPKDRARREQLYQAVRDFTAAFKQRHGSIVCRELLGCDLGQPDGYERAIRENLFLTRCPIFVRDAVEVLGQLL
jgi:C_GCAxxG_C_C family probable redox protein